jgi:hypothetical protein
MKPNRKEEAEDSEQREEGVCGGQLEQAVQLGG